MSEGGGNNGDRRQRQMDFILEHQAKFTADIEELKAADERALKRTERLERVVKLMVRALRRERRDFRDRINVLFELNAGTEALTRSNAEAIAALTIIVRDIATKQSGNGSHGNGTNDAS